MPYQYFVLFYNTEILPGFLKFPYCKTIRNIDTALIDLQYGNFRNPGKIFISCARLLLTNISNNLQYQILLRLRNIVDQIILDGISIKNKRIICSLLKELLFAIQYDTNQNKSISGHNINSVLEIYLLQSAFHLSLLKKREIYKIIRSYFFPSGYNYISSRIKQFWNCNDYRLCACIRYLCFMLFETGSLKCLKDIIIIPCSNDILVAYIIATSLTSLLIDCHHMKNEEFQKLVFEWYGKALLHLDTYYRFMIVKQLIIIYEHKKYGYEIAQAILHNHIEYELSEQIIFLIESIE